MKAKNPLKSLFDAVVAQKGAGAYKQKQYAADLRDVAESLGYRGYSDGAVSTKIRLSDLTAHNKFRELCQIVQALCVEKKIDPDRIFRAQNEGEVTGVMTSQEISALGLNGVWQHLMLQNISERNVIEPSFRVRRALLIYEGSRFRIIGNTTTWQGEMRVRRHHVYPHAIEDGEHEEVFGIYQLPLPRRGSERPIYHCGLCIGVAMGEHDYPSFPVVANRCVLRRLDIASNQLERDGAGPMMVQAWKKVLCGYIPLEEMRSASIENLNEVPEADRLETEQFIYIDELLARLHEYLPTRNFGERIFLR